MFYCMASKQFFTLQLKSKSMILTSLQQILSVSSAITEEQYADHHTALSTILSDRLPRLIHCCQSAQLSSRIQYVVNTRIVPSLHKTLEEIELFQMYGDHAKLSDFVCRIKCEIEMARIFFEGVYRYFTGAAIA